MLVISRKKNETVKIANNIEVVVLAISAGGKVKIGIQVPREVQITRPEAKAKA